MLLRRARRRSRQAQARLREAHDVILAWTSLFHLSAEDRRAMFATFAAHSHHRTVLMFTSGPDIGEATGTAGGLAIYHASLAPWEYRDLLMT